MWVLQEYSATNWEIVIRFRFAESLRLRRETRAYGARLSPPANSRAFGAHARASRSFVLAPSALVRGSIAQNRVFDKD